MRHKKLLGWVTIFLILFAIAIYFIVTDIILKTHTRGPPHIIVIIADDIGYNDVSFHGSNEIPTPNIDALAYNGIILDRFYTQAFCSPSRAAFLTGNYPIRSGMQGDPIATGEDINLPTNMRLMSEHLNKLDYKSHLVGKWHLGYSRKVNTPTGRGFRNFLGYWNGHTGYFDYMSTYQGVQGFDLHNGWQPAWAHKGKYATDLFTDEALHVIDKHTHAHPLFLIISHIAAHVGEYDELGVPNITETDAKYSHIKDPRRRRYAGVIDKLDESVGKVVKKLSEKKMLQNSIILFFSDNGGGTIGLHNNTGSNWPLRGSKGTHFEGGVKGSAAIFSPLFTKKNYINKELIHLVDFLPTFYTAAGGKLSDLGEIDGVSQWDTLSENKASGRTDLLLDVDEVVNVSSVISQNGKYKLVIGNFSREKIGWSASAHLGDSGRGNAIPPYNITAVLQSHVSIETENLTQIQLTEANITKLRAEVDLSSCNRSEHVEVLDCTDKCLFDLEEDPCESTNLIGEKVEIADKLLQILDGYKKTMVPQPPRMHLDELASPKYYNYTFCTWLDDGECPKTK